MECSYCFEDKDRTREHIIPDGILDLFPECDISIREDKVFKSDLIIKDVCSNCNNSKLSSLDSYGKTLISNHFVKEYRRNDKVTFKYDYDMLSRWLLKICYNYSRSHNLDVEWFVKNIRYILDGMNRTALFSIYSGLSINTSPMQAFMLGNIKMSICHSPLLCDTGFLIPIDAFGQQFKIIDDLRPLKFEEVKETFLIRFGSALFLIFLWKDGVDKSKIKIVEDLMSRLFRYKTLDDNNVVTIERCTEATTYHMTNVVIGDLGITLGDMANGFVRTDIPAEYVQAVWGNRWDWHVQEVRKKHKMQKQIEKNRKKKKK